LILNVEEKETLERKLYCCATSHWDQYRGIKKCCCRNFRT